MDWVGISLGNGLSPIRCQAITWTNVGLLLIGLLGTNFSEIPIGILSFSFKKMHLKFTSAKMAVILSRGDELSQVAATHSEISTPIFSLRWRHNERDGVSSHQPYDCLLNRLFRHRSKKTSKLRVTGLCVGNSPETGEFPAQIASNAENVSIWWRHHVCVGGT